MADSISSNLFLPSSGIRRNSSSNTLPVTGSEATNPAGAGSGGTRRLLNLQMGEHWNSLLKPKESGPWSFTPVQLDVAAGEYGPASLRTEASLGRTEWSQSQKVGRTELAAFGGGGIHLRHTVNPDEKYQGQAFQPNFAGLRLNAGVRASTPLQGDWKGVVSSEVGFEAAFKNLKPMPYSLTMLGVEKSKSLGSGEVIFGAGVQHLSTPLSPSSFSPYASLTYRF